MRATREWRPYPHTLMSHDVVRLTYIGGPTALIELAGVRLLTDPTFDPAGTEYPAKGYTLVKQQSPAIGTEAIGCVDAVLLSHDHHADNFDAGGRAVARHATRVLTTVDGAARLGDNAIGLLPWQSVEVGSISGRTVTVTATPARHGPAGGDRGPVVGFMIDPHGDSDGAVYVSGDTVWFEGVAEAGRRFDVRVAILFMGAARVSVAGPAPLTFTAAEGLAVARAFPKAVIVPLHFEGWAHFSESRAEIDRTFEAAGMADRLRWLTPGEPVDL